MAHKHKLRLEPEEQVLPARVDSEQTPPVKARRDLQNTRPRVDCLDTDRVAHEGLHPGRDRAE